MLGASIGDYRIVAKVGQGGMGVVYRAVHDTLDRAAAVKVLLPAVSNRPEMIARLFNEARSARAARHPGVVEIYDFGILPGHVAYIMMEFLRGKSLAQHLRHSPCVPYASALQIAGAVARALHAVHEQGIVHRDLKPGNIFLASDPGAPGGTQVKLVDFGIAKPGGECAHWPTLDHATLALTHTGAVMGTPPYMSPEQCRGAGQVDHRADLYALGCILYELVCNRPPFIVDGAGDIIAHHLYFYPEPPRTYDGNIPPGLEALIIWLLQKDPCRRPATAAEVVTAIDDLDLTDMPVAPRPVGKRLLADTFDGAPTTTRRGAMPTCEASLIPTV
jgi:serine/threonine-protein kinase